MSLISFWSSFCSLVSHNREIVGRWLLECDLPSDAPYWVESISIFCRDGKYIELLNKTAIDVDRYSSDEHSTTKEGRYSIRDRIITISINDSPSHDAWYIYSISESILILAHYDPSTAGEYEAMMADVARYKADTKQRLSDYFCIYRRLD